MLEIRSQDTIHKSYLNRLLIEIIDQPMLAHSLAFKGGTCAAMLGHLDRFSVDLDFDILKNADEVLLRTEFYKIFKYLDLMVINELAKGLFFQLRYPSEPGKRSTLKISASNIQVKANLYQVQYLAEIDRLCNCQTIETMFANKLVAVTDRYRMHQTIAGRDIYDIHYFFVHGIAYHAPVIVERSGVPVREYFEELIHFINTHVSQTAINEDLNALLPYRKYQQIRKILIPETMAMLKRELARLESV